MSKNTKLCNRMNGLTVAAVIILSIGLNLSIFGNDIVHATDAVRVAASSVAAPMSSATAMLMAVQMPR